MFWVNNEKYRCTPGGFGAKVGILFMDMLSLCKKNMSENGFVRIVIIKWTTLTWKHLFLHTLSLTLNLLIHLGRLRIVIRNIEP